MKSKDTVDIDDISETMEKFVAWNTSFPQVRWESDQYPDEISDVIIYMQDIIDLAETIINMSESRGLKSVPRAIYNDFKMFVRGFNWVYEKAEPKFEQYFN
jgi:hypothetical protein